ncbi:unnamed protein product [Rotaria magnacalcarata]
MILFRYEDPPKPTKSLCQLDAALFALLDTSNFDTKTYQNLNFLALVLVSKLLVSSRANKAASNWYVWGHVVCFAKNIKNENARKIRAHTRVITRVTFTSENKYVDYGSNCD